MTHLLILGIVLATGHLAGVLARRVGLPKVTGYLLAGVLLSHDVSSVIPADWVQGTGFATNLALAFITFEVGGSLHWKRIRALGRSIVWITVFEAELAFLFVTAGIALAGVALGGLPGGIGPPLVVPFALMLGALGSPTDPSATLAVSHEYHAKGPVTDTIMGVAALDDVFGIVNFSLGVAAAGILLHGASHHAASLRAASTGAALQMRDLLAPAGEIAGALAIGAAFGLLFSGIAEITRKDSDGALIVVVVAMLCLCYGVLESLRLDPLLGTMSSGCVTVNVSRRRDEIFTLLERYTEELIFVLFFTLSGMHLSLDALAGSAILVVAFVALRALGKFTGVRVGAAVGRAAAPVRRYTAFGLLPQGGIVIGLALTAQNDPRLAGALAAPLLGIVIGATVLHEFIGPLVARAAIRGAGEAPGKTRTPR